VGAWRTCAAEGTTSRRTGVDIGPAVSATRVLEIVDEAHVTFPIGCDRGTAGPSDDLSPELHVTSHRPLISTD
jgi:hypothetical protein